jgi:uncharacterized protein (DUF1330 family)
VKEKIRVLKSPTGDHFFFASLAARSAPPSDTRLNRKRRMSKAYWISTYQKINDPDKLAAYAALAGPAITACGGKFIVRGMPARTYEAGVNERTVVIEFDSVDAAIAAHDSPDYAAALEALDDGAVREIRIIEGT